MHDDEYADLFKPRKPRADTTWEDVGREFVMMGHTLGDALRAAWDNHAADDQVRGMRESLNSLADEVNRTVAQGFETPEGARARAQLEQLTESIRSALEQTGDELRPELLTLLRQANAELRRLTGQGE
jgi:hypothetical protein